jgi:hypothetical protein
MITNVWVLFAAEDLVQRMMQLLEQNMTKQTAELQATAQERDKYKAKSKTVLLP